MAAKTPAKPKKGVDKEQPAKAMKRTTFAGRRCPEGDVPKQRFLSMMETYAAMIFPKLKSPSQCEASLIGGCIFKGIIRFRRFLGNLSGALVFGNWVRVGLGWGSLCRVSSGRWCFPSSLPWRTPRAASTIESAEMLLWSS